MIRGVLIAVSAAILLAVPPGAAHAVAAALPAYQVTREFDVGLAHINALDLDGDSLYVSSVRYDYYGGRVAAFDFLTGERRWRIKLECAGAGPFAFGKAVLAEDTHCSISKEHPFLGLRAADGQTSFTIDGLFGTASDRMAFLVEGPTLRAITETGHVRWRYDSQGSWPFTLSATDRTLYLADGNDLIALRTKNGTERWRVPFGDVRFERAFEAEGRLFVVWHGAGAGASPPRLVALDAASAEVLWGVSDVSARDVDAGVIYTLEGGGELGARSVGDGALLWTVPASGYGFWDVTFDAGIVWGTATDTTGVTYEAFDPADGSSLGMGPWSQVLRFARGSVLVPTNDGRVLAYEPVG